MIFRGGQEDLAKKKSGCDFREKNSPARRAGKTKIIRLALGSSFALQNLFSHSQIRFCSLESAFRTPYLNCFTHSKNYIIYFGNDFSYYKKEVFRSLKKVSCDGNVVRTWMSTPSTPPRFNTMSSGRIKINSPAQWAGEEISPAPKSRPKKILRLT